MIYRLVVSILLALGLVSSPVSQDVATAESDTPDARKLLGEVIDLTRGLTSYAEMTMTIHRPDWERSSSLVAWTRGREDGLIRFTSPARDAGNATLKDDERMWTYTPRLNRVIRLPFSMMSQGWAGSDFSYNDLSQTDSLLHDYDLRVTNMAEQGEHIIYTVEAVPHDSAPVVWGKEVIVFRDDYVLVEHLFYDQDMQLLKRLEATEVTAMGGRTFATTMRMIKLDEPDHWTQLHYTRADFDITLDDELFTVYALKTGLGDAP